MIPSDLAARLRMLNEASFLSGEPNVSPLARVREIPANLPEFLPGQRIVAKLQQGSGQDNTFKALVEGRSVTLALPQSSTVGDSIELVVSHVTQGTVFAALANPAASAAATAANTPALSQTGKLISFLLTGQPAQEATSLNGGKPLLPTAPQPGDAGALASRLGAALEESGLFYESHQARWLSGQIDTASLQREPQGKETAAPALANRAASSASAATAAAEAAESTGPLPLQPRASDTAAPIPERILPLVHQQLDAIATQHLVWQGQVWPGQNMEWEIEDPAREGSPQEEDAEAYWNTTLRLTLPNLGGVEARLHLTPAGIAMRLVTDEQSTVTAMEAARQRLADALDAANVPLTGMVAELKALP